MMKLLMGVAKWAGAGAVTVLLAWQAAIVPTAEESEVIIHVSLPDVEIQVDEFRFAVDRALERPVLCELPPGEHLLTMTREGVELYREVFAVESGRDCVLTAWDEKGLLRDDPGASSLSEPRTAFQSRAAAGAGVAPNLPRRN